MSREGGRKDGSTLDVGEFLFKRNVAGLWLKFTYLSLFAKLTVREVLQISYEMSSFFCFLLVRLWIEDSFEKLLFGGKKNGWAASARNGRGQ